MAPQLTTAKLEMVAMSEEVQPHGICPSILAPAGSQTRTLLACATKLTCGLIWRHAALPCKGDPCSHPAFFYLQQIIPWLSRLIDPAQIQMMIDSLDNTIQGSLNPINANLTRDLNQTVRPRSSLQM